MRLRATVATARELSAAFGFEVPPFLARVVAVAHARARGDAWRFVTCYEDASLAYLGGPLLEVSIDGDVEDGVDRYATTPPELFPFGWSGVDGTHYGFVAHAPEELGAVAGIGELCPFDRRGVLCIGEDLAAAFAGLFAHPLHHAIDDVDRKLELLGLARELGLEPAPGDAVLAPRRVSTPVPRGWRFAPTIDGLGVLAPAAGFDPLAAPPPVADVPAVLAWARRARDRGHPASALVALRDAWFAHASPEATYAVATELAPTYQVLRRPLLAAIVERERLASLG